MSERPIDVTYVVQALWKLGAMEPSLPPLLVTLLTTGNNALPFDYPAIELLGLQGASAEAAEPLLRCYLKDDDVSIRCAAAAVLARISCAVEEEMVVFLIAQLEQRGDYAPRMFVAQQLASLGPVAAPAIPSLRAFTARRRRRRQRLPPSRRFRRRRLNDRLTNNRRGPFTAERRLHAEITRLAASPLGSESGPSARLFSRAT